MASRMNREISRRDLDAVELRCHGVDPLSIPFATRAAGYVSARAWRARARRAADEGVQLRAGLPYTAVQLVDSAERVGATRGETLRSRFELDYFSGDPIRLPFGAPLPLP